MRFSAVHHITKMSNGGSTPHGADGCIIILSITSRTLRIMSVATKHTGHDRFIASSGHGHLRPWLRHFTELRTSHMTLWAHVGVLEFLSPVTPGQAGSAPAKSSIEFRFIENLPCFVAYFYAGCQGTKRAVIWICPVMGVFSHSTSVISPARTQTVFTPSSTI